tara:strand:+ start:187 stop:684 length:498 start_codon:yes stop_codon:yes gene_type:complete
MTRASDTARLLGTGGTFIQGLPVGSVIQTVEAQSAPSPYNPGTSFGDVTGTSISITPSSTSNKILVMWNCGGMANGTNNSISFKVLRGSTVVRYIPRYGYESGSGWDAVPIAIQYLDAPSTTSSVTYKLQSATEADQDFRINDIKSVSDDANTDAMVVIAMEIKG